MPQGSNEMIQLELSSNANEVVARLGRLHPLISKAIIRALNLSALVVKTQAKMLQKPRTGNLRASIGSRVENLRQEAFVGSPVEYAPYVEYGTGIHAEGGGGRKTPWVYQDWNGNWHYTHGQLPRPFMRNGIDMTRKDATRAFWTEVRKAL